MEVTTRDFFIRKVMFSRVVTKYLVIDVTKNSPIQYYAFFIFHVPNTRVPAIYVLTHLKILAYIMSK